MICLVFTGIEADEFSQHKKLLDSLEMAITNQKKKIDQLVKSQHAISGKISRHTDKITVSKISYHQLLKELNTLNFRLDSLKKQAGITTVMADSIRRELIAILPVYYKACRHYENRMGYPEQKLSFNLQPLIYLKNFSLYQWLRIHDMIDTLSTLQSGISHISHTRQVATDQKSRQTKIQEQLIREKENLEQTLSELDQKKDQLTTAYQEKLQDKKKIEQWLTNYEENRKKETQVLPSLKYSFRALKHKLDWPIPGKILSNFGRQIDKQYQTKTFMNGIEIEPGSIRDVSAIAPGIVRFADWHRSYGRFLIIEHSQGYYSIYGYLESMNVNPGQVVKKSQIIGRVSPNSITAKEKLFFAIYQGDQMLNPLDWLKSNPAPIHPQRN